MKVKKIDLHQLVKQHATSMYWLGVWCGENSSLTNEDIHKNKKYIKLYKATEDTLAAIHATL